MLFLIAAHVCQQVFLCAVASFLLLGFKVLALFFRALPRAVEPWHPWSTCCILCPLKRLASLQPFGIAVTQKVLLNEFA